MKLPTRQHEDVPAGYEFIATAWVEALESCPLQLPAWWHKRTGHTTLLAAELWLHEVLGEIYALTGSYGALHLRKVFDYAPPETLEALYRMGGSKEVEHALQRALFPHVEQLGVPRWGWLRKKLSGVD